MASDGSRSFGYAWITLCLALALHVLDEALTGFLSVYNPTVLALRERLGWFPAPVFTFEVWLGGLIAAVVLLLALSGFAFRNARSMRILAGAFAALMLLNACGHTAGTLFGRTFAGVTFERPMPGFYSSPALALASVYLLVRLRRTSPSKPGA